MIYSATFHVRKPCDTIGCSCNTGRRFIAYSHRPTKAQLIAVEPHAERIVLECKMESYLQGAVQFRSVSAKTIRRLHAGVNGRRVDSWTTWMAISTTHHALTCR